MHFFDIIESRRIARNLGLITSELSFAAAVYNLSLVLLGYLAALTANRR
jgi:hypothetical protein